MKRIALVTLLVLAAGCYTIRGTFTSMKPDYTQLPADSVAKVAHEIEQAVANGEREPKIANLPDVVVHSESIDQAIRSRAAREELIDTFRSTGNAWERRDGLIWILKTKAYHKTGTSRDRDRDALLVNGENENRWAIYEGLIKVNKWSPRSLGAIQEIFFKARLEFLSPGEKYEGKDGNPAVKNAS